MKTFRIDLFSDTITRPTPEMRQYIAQAEVGDEQLGEDPTVNALNLRMAELLGKEAALFLPTGTMCNQIAIRIHCRQGDEIIADQHAHIQNYEAGGPAALSGVSTFSIQGNRGIYTGEQLKKAIRPDEVHNPRSRAIIVEQTANIAGGSIWPLETIQEVCGVAKENGLACHMDGARLFNASAATQIPAKDYAAPFDSVWVDFSKGLGAPVGAALAGSADFIREAKRFKHQFGGAMRQAGIIAAGALFAIDHHLERLSEDHQNAKILASGLQSIEGIEVEQPVETNMVFFQVDGFSSVAFNEKLEPFGIRFSPVGPSRLRAVTHLQIEKNHIEEVLDVVAQVCQKG